MVYRKGPEGSSVLQKDRRIQFKTRNLTGHSVALMQGPFAYVCQMCHPLEGDIHCSGVLWQVCAAAELF